MKRFITAFVLVALAASGAAGAAKYQVYLGESKFCGFEKCTGVPAGIPKGTTLNMFLPGSVTINAGDSVTFSSASFHTVSFGGTPARLIVPDPAKGKYASLADTLKSPFSFTGLPKMIYNGGAFAPFGPPTVSGSTPTSSGVLSPAGPKAKPATYSYTFPTAGTFKLVCNVHPGMKGTVVVKPAGAAVPKSPAQVEAQALTETSAAWADAAASGSAIKPSANTVFMGFGKTWTVLGYFPQALKVKAGTTVTFVNKAPVEVHNVVFGPKKYILGLQKTTDLFPTGPKSPNQTSPFLVYGSEPKGQYSFDGANHGNGFLSTPLNAGAPGQGLSQSWAVTFTKPGTYSYFCWIHGPEMSGKIIVTG